ncbi:MAG: uL15 family ribosomal protein, partial [Clostridia bacterium]|nr:uL15 family ribosomal protein [Clostridia bacterium]
SSDECDIVFSGGAIGAGGYTAYATAASSDFEIINARFNFEIKKAENFFTAPPGIGDFYEGQAPSPSGTSAEGEVKFEYFCDSECKESAELPLTYGIYYMRATAPESENYTEYKSAPIRFKVIEVVPVGIEITLNKTTYSAFESVLPGDFILTAIYNDGTRREVPYSEIDIEYQGGEDFRARDEGFSVSWQGFSLFCNITVIRADYDLSGVRWENIKAVYDGDIKHPEITGLPLGVTVKEYIGGARDAGEYSVIVLLDYDAENYNHPDIAPCQFTIIPAVVKIPVLNSAVYSGAPISVQAGSALYDILAGEMINAGRYTVKARLKDAKNYIFEDGNTEISLDFTVERRPIRISIEDLTLYLFERERMPEYTMLDSSYTDETLDLYYKIDGESIYILTANPNFVIDAPAARLIRSSRLSARAREWVATSIIIIIILLLLAIVFIKHKDRIFDKIARARCKNRIARAEKEGRASAVESDAPRIPTKIQAEAPSDLTPLKCENELLTVNVERADSLISDSLAKSLLRREGETVYTSGNKRGVVNVDTLSESFNAGEVICVNDMKKKRIVSQDTLSVKVLARGRIDKPLLVKANAFSLSAVKMIALSGGEAIKVNTKYDKRWREKNKDAIEKDTGV